tara:strand:- start:3667 stop:4197 length:531 start_codon:yes stop_codon:yes gene_type:complete
MAAISAAGWAAIGSATVSAGVGVAQYQKQQEAQRKQEKASELEQRKAAVQNARERRRAVAQQQVAQSQVQAQQAAQSGSTTGTEQTLGAIGSQTAGNISFQNTMAQMNNQQIDFMNQANQARGQASTLGQVAALPGQFGMSPGDFLSQGSFFRQPTTPGAPAGGYNTSGFNAMRNY